MKDSLSLTIVFTPEQMGDFNQLVPSNFSFYYKDPKSLYVVNGIILSDKKKKKFLNKRHGNDIESFQVVAVPVYGELAANGAVLITTR